MCGGREDEGHGIREADIFGGADQDAARDEARVFASVDHFREPIKRRVWIAAAHRFDEGGDRVVMRVAVAVVNNRSFLDALFGGGEIDDDCAVRTSIGGECGDLE